MNIYFSKVTYPTLKVVDTLNRWGNNPVLISLTRRNRNQAELEQQKVITLESMIERLKYENVYLIYKDDQLIGEMNFMVDPGHLYKKEPGTAWIGITIGEPEGRGIGIGAKALLYLEEQIEKQGLKRIELGVFEFNTKAHALYQRLGYSEIGRVKDFTYYENKMWSDIRMEKYL